MYSWRVPNGAKGRYRLIIEADYGPFETVSPEEWHTFTRRR